MFLLRKQAVGVYLPSLITNVIWATKPLSSCLLVFIFYPWCLAVWSATWKATGGSPGAQVALPSPSTAARGHGEGVEETTGAAGASALSMSCWNPQCCPGAGQAPGGDFFSERAWSRKKSSNTVIQVAQRFWVKKRSFPQTLEIFWSEDQHFNNCSLQSPSKGASAPSPAQGTSPGS